MKELPIGIQTFSKIREGNYYYVDKTMFVKSLKNGKYFSLSRPRRFGKSLFLDMLKEAFSGNKELFKGLYLYDNWDWDRKYPVVKFDLSQVPSDTEENLTHSLISLVKHEAKKHSITIEEKHLSNVLGELLKKLCEKYNKRVVVLIDNSDKPILDVIDDKEKAKKNKEIMKDFYQVLKPLDPYLEFVFMTGVIKVLYASMFGGLNNILDISDSPKFSTVCGYTRPELETIFSDRLEGVDLEELKRWYNGYNWLGEKVYNPFDILLFLDNKIYKPYWFEAGKHDSIIKLIKEQGYHISNLEDLKAGERVLSYLDIDNLEVDKLLFQTGYLTIKEECKLGELAYYVLGYPNFEVRKSLNDALLKDI